MVNWLAESAPIVSITGVLFCAAVHQKETQLSKAENGKKKLALNNFLEGLLYSLTPHNTT